MIGIGLNIGMRQSGRSLFAGAALNLDLRDPAVDALLTTVRASDAYQDDEADVWYLFAPNVRRKTDKGGLIEEARTNGIRNNSMQGAVAGTPGTLPTNWSVTQLAGLTQTIVGVGTDNGIDYIDIRLNGTSNNTLIRYSPEAINIIAAASGQSWTESFFYKVVGGSTANVSGLRAVIFGMLLGGTVTETFVGATDTTLGSIFQRVLGTAAFVGGTTEYARPTIDMLIANGAAVDITLRIGWPQLELGAFVTSPIRTTSAAATRAADAITATLTIGSEWTLFSEFSVSANTASTFPTAIALDDGTNNERTSIFVATSADLARALVTDGGVSQADITSGSVIAYGAVVKAAAAYKLNDIAISVNGATVGTDTSATLPSVNMMRIGSNVGANFLNGYIRRVVYWNTKQSPAFLQATTT